MAFVAAGGLRLEVQGVPGADAGAPRLVFLHEGVGSVAFWKGFPRRLSAATGCPALIYSRAGHGRSDPPSAPRGPDYLAREATETLPALLDEMGIDDPILVGHEEGAAIALIFAAESGRRIRGLALETPPVFVEERMRIAVRRAAEAFRRTGIARRLGRYHDDPEETFRCWHDAWLDPAFRLSGVEAMLPRVRCPVLALRGAEDRVVGESQLEALVRGVAGPVEDVTLPACGHAPHRDQPVRVADAMARFVAGLRRA